VQTPPSVATQPVPPLPPGHVQTVVEEEIGGTVHTHETATGTGASIDARGNEAAADHDASAPTSQLSTGIGGASGGTLRSRITAIGGDPKGMAILGVGIALLLAAGAALYFGLRRAAIFLGIGGAGFIVAALLPAWAWIVLAAVALIGGGVYLWAEYGGRRSHEALRAVAAGVADTKKNAPETYAMVKERIAAHADAADVRTIAKVKMEDRL
jgi:hypothetical protein